MWRLWTKSKLINALFHTQWTKQKRNKRPAFTFWTKDAKRARLVSTSTHTSKTKIRCVSFTNRQAHVPKMWIANTDIRDQTMDLFLPKILNTALSIKGAFARLGGKVELFYLVVYNLSASFSTIASLKTFAKTMRLDFVTEDRSAQMLTLRVWSCLNTCSWPC